jgi:hypothetical protein
MPVPSFDDYLASLSEPERAELERVRQFVRPTVPDVEEGTSYGCRSSNIRSGRS